MNNTIIYLALIEAAVTFCFARVALMTLGPDRKKTAILLSGLTIPILTAAAAIIIFVEQPVYKAAWSDLAFGAMLVLALATLPLCLGVAGLAIYLPKRTG